MKPLLLFVAVSIPLLGIDGTVRNGTKDKPQANATVSLFQITQNGPQMLTSVKSAADGKFNIELPADKNAPGPKLLQAVYGGVTYSRMIPPGTPDTNLQIDVFDSTGKPSAVKVMTHMMLLEPANGKLNVNESFLYSNASKVTYNDPDRGTVRFYVPAASGGQMMLNVLSPNSVPVRKAADKTDQPDIYKLDFPIKPGESRVDLNYQMPFASPGEFVSKVIFKDPNTKVLVPVGVTLTAPGLQALGQEPQTKATIYNFDGPELRIEVQGSGTIPRENTAQGDAGATGGQGDAGGDQGSGEQISELMPQLYNKANPADGLGAAVNSVKWVLMLVFAMLALAFSYLYRKPAPEVTASDEPRR